MTPFIDLSIKGKPYEQEVLAAAKDVLESGRFIGGEHVNKFEEEFAAYIGTKHMISCASGTDALLLALKAIGVGPGDQVIVPSFTYYATASTVVLCGAVPVFCDVDERTCNIDVNSAAQCINEKTKAIIPVHMFGLPANMDAIMELANKHKLYVIEDCAQSTGATVNGTQTGNIGHIGCFSFFPTKNLGCYGDGGGVTTNDDKLAANIRKLKSQGQAKKYFHDIIGYNSRLDNLQAAMLRVKLKYLDQEIAARQAKAKQYDDTLENVITPHIPDGLVHTYNQYTIQVDDRDAYIKMLDEQGLPYMIYYPRALHEQTCFAFLGYKKEDLPISAKLCEKVLSLAIFDEF